MKNINNIVTKVKKDDFVKSIEGLESFLSESNLDLVVEAGGFIAGGFIRHIMRSKKISAAYFGSTRFNTDRGDVDIFFRNKIDLKRATKYLDKNNISIHESTGGFAKDITLEAKAVGQLWDFYNHDDNVHKFFFKTQLVDCIFGEPEEILTNFDIANCMVGFDDKYFYIVDEERRAAAESENLILLNSEKNHNSFLASRIKKYIDKYGYAGISKESIETFKKYLVEILCDDDNLKNLNSRLPVRTSKTQPFLPQQTTLIKKLIQEMPEEELVMFIGKIQIPTDTGYGKVIIKDACIEEFNRRSGGQCD